jgi:hypothetical protein
MILAACGGGSSSSAGGVAPATWAHSVCTAMKGWRDKLQKGSQDIQASVAGATTPEAARTTFVDFLKGAETSTDQMLSELQAAGQPDVSKGADIAKDLSNALGQAKPVFQQAVSTAETLPVDDPAKFSQGAAALGTQMQTSFTTFTTALDGIDKKYSAPALDAAVKRDAVCKELQA